mgnify:CR=1 FL=1
MKALSREQREELINEIATAASMAETPERRDYLAGVASKLKGDIPVMLRRYDGDCPCTAKEREYIVPFWERRIFKYRGSDGSKAYEYYQYYFAEAVDFKDRNGEDIYKAILEDDRNPYFIIYYRAGSPADYAYSNLEAPYL